MTGTGEWFVDKIKQNVQSMNDAELALRDVLREAQGIDWDHVAEEHDLEQLAQLYQLTETFNSSLAQLQVMTNLFFMMCKAISGGGD